MSRRITQDEVLDHLDYDDVDPDVRALAHYQRVLRQARRLDPRDPDYVDPPEADAAYALAHLPGWLIGTLLVLLFVVLPAVSASLGPSELDATIAIGAASRDIERGPL